MLFRRLRTALVIVLGVALCAGGWAMPAAADTNVTLPLNVNFQADTTTTPAGFTGDIGQPYDATRGFGWTDVSGTPVSLVGNGRERGVAADKKLDTFIHMQLPEQSTGQHVEGRWKAAVANGTYSVTVAAGDPGNTDSHDVLRAEGNTILDFTPSGTTTSAVKTSTVVVSDGFLDIDASGGTNTKIDYVQIVAVPTGSPTVTAVDPANGATGVSTAAAVTVQLSAGVDPATATSANLKLIDPNNNQVPGFYNTDGAYSNATFVPASALATNTKYTIQTTTGLKDPRGNSYPAFTSFFTTGTSGVTQAQVSFNKSVLDVRDAPTALALEPGGGGLWAAFGNGSLMRYALDSNGKKVGTPTEVTTFKFNRAVSGLRFDPSATATNLKLWVSNGQFGCDLAVTGVACDDMTGAISVLTGTSPTALTKRDVISGLPRSVGNHMNNGMDFGPDGRLYWAQGANNGYGSPDAIWGNRAEVPLAAAILVADVNSISGTVNVSTAAGYNPNAAGAPVKTYVTGTRNPFSVIWHSNGKLYAPVNESANGNTPADPSGKAPALNDLPAFDDYFTQLVPGKYYGHPNPTRNEYILNGANPTAGVDPFEVPQYPVGTQPNANWRQPDLDLGMHRSADGTTEFKSDVFGSNLKGQILTTEYSQGKDIIAVRLDANGKPVSTSQVMSGFNNPLPITSDPVSGRVYVGEYGADPTGAGGQIDLLTPDVTTPPSGGSVTKVNFQAQTSVTPAGYGPDFGQAFDPTRGYGWENAAGSPLALVGNGRERNVVSDKRLDTFLHMQLPANSTGVTTPGRWELVIPNGTYNVTVGVGDPSFTDSHDVIRAEGNVIVDYTPTTAAPNKVVTAQVVVTDGRLTLDASGGANTKINYVDVGTTDGQPIPPDTTPPTVAVNVSGTTDVSGAYQGSAGVTIDTSDAGSGVKNVTYKLDGGPDTPYNTAFTVSAVGNHTVVATAVDNVNNTATSTKTFTVVAPPVGAPTIKVTTPEDMLGLGSRLVFSTVGYEKRPGHALTITNTGQNPLNITNMVIGGPQGASFVFDAGQAKTFTVAPGASTKVNVSFSFPVQTYVNTGTLTISSNDSANPTYVVTLGGLNPPAYEGGVEPSMPQIAQALGYNNINIPLSGVPESQSISTGNSAVGDEVLAPYWKKLDTAKPVGVLPVAHYSGRQTTIGGPIGWYSKGTSTKNQLFYFNGGSDPSGGQNQRLLPIIAAGTTSFNSNNSFGIWDGDGDWSDDAKNPGGIHNVRAFPAKDLTGKVIPGSYLVTIDLGAANDDGKNYDYQDYVLLLTNVQPDVAVATPAPSPGAASLNLTFSSAVTGTVLDSAGRGTGFKSVQSNTVGDQYLASKLNLNTTTGQLKVTSTVGSASAGANTQQNALQSPFNATTGNWRVNARLIGPFTNITFGSQQEAIFFGPDQDNFIKVEIERSDAQTVLTLWKEQNGVGAVVTSIPMPNVSATTLDLYLDGSFSSKTVQARYSVNGGAITALGTAQAVPAGWFSTNAPGGIIVSNENSATAITATYDSFAIVAN